MSDEHMAAKRPACYRYNAGHRRRAFNVQVDKRIAAVRWKARESVPHFMEDWLDIDARRLGRQLWHLGVVELARQRGRF